MRKTVTFSMLAMSLLLATAAANADTERGKQLHDKKCMACHDTSVYIRPERRMQSIPMLDAQVRRCSGPASAGWDDTQIKDVIEYLNQTFYKFK